MNVARQCIACRRLKVSSQLTELTPPVSGLAPNVAGPLTLAVNYIPALGRSARKDFATA